MKIKNIIAVLAVLAASQAKAKVWGDYIAGGTSCNMNNVSVIENGNDLSVLFDEFGVDMASGDSFGGLSVRKTCNFRITLTPPKGFYLAGFKQVYSGGLIKSRNSNAQLNINYNVGAVRGIPLPIVWRQGSQIQPQDASSLFSATYNNDLLVLSCGGSTLYGINMSFSATRTNKYEFIQGGLDSVDASFRQKLVLIPDWRLCGR